MKNHDQPPPAGNRSLTGLLRYHLILLGLTAVMTGTGMTGICHAQGGWSPSGLDGQSITSMTIDAHGEMMAATRLGLFRSTDNGMSWDTTALNQITRSVTVTDEGYAYATLTLLPTGRSGLARSSDWGATWRIDTIPGFPRGLETDRFGTPIMVQSDSLFSSTDHGATWQPVPSSGFTGGFFDFATLAVGPQNELALGNRGITGGLIFYSVNHFGDRPKEDYWHESYRLSGDVSMLEFSTTGTLFSSAAERVYRSSDAGETWTNLTEVSDTTGGGGKFNQRTAMAMRGDELFLFTNKLYRSTDDGLSWNRLADLPPFPPNNGMNGAVVAADGSLIAFTSSGIYRYAGASSVPTEHSGAEGMSLTSAEIPSGNHHTRLRK